VTEVEARLCLEEPQSEHRMDEARVLVSGNNGSLSASFYVIAVKCPVLE
jgi:hypothetical protein